MRLRTVFVGLAAIPLVIGMAATGGASTNKETKALNAFNDSVTARCPSGQHVVLGGMKAQFDMDGYSYIEELSRPSNRVLRVGSYLPSDGALLTAIATCGREPRSREVAETRELADDVEGSVSARCGNGDHLVFGGFRAALTPFEERLAPLAARARSQGRRWKVTGLNASSGPSGDLTALAYCGDAPKVKERADTEVVGDSGDTATATATCKRSERLAFGGFDVNTPGIATDYLTVTQLKRSGSRKWKVTAVNDGAEPGNDVTAYAYCAKR